MMLTDDTLRDLAAALDHAGARVDLPTGRALHLREEADDVGPLEQINGVDVYGRVGWGRKDGYRSSLYVGCQTKRPDGFDGRARVLLREGDLRLWWQPPATVPDGDLAHEAARVRDAVTYGFRVAFVELVDGRDAYGSPIVREFECLGALEWDWLDDESYRLDVLEQLAGDVLERAEVPAG